MSGISDSRTAVNVDNCVVGAVLVAELCENINFCNVGPRMKIRWPDKIFFNGVTKAVNREYIVLQSDKVALRRMKVGSKLAVRA